MRGQPVFLQCLLGGLILASAAFPLEGRAAQQVPVPPGADETAPKTPQPSTDAVKKELTDIIDAQLAAFRTDDYAKAYGFAASSVREMFPPAAFESMVRTGYPVIAHSTRAFYGLTFDTGEEAVVNVRIEDAARNRGEFQYLLKKEGGAWKINGVSQLKASDLAV
jgi:hypothetical protein